MTVKTRSALRFSAAVVTSTLVLCLLLSVLMRHAWADGVADGRAAIAAAHDPTTDPAAYGQDVVTLYRGGQWVALGLALFAGSFSALRFAARRWSMTGIGAFAVYLAAAIGIGGATLAMLIKLGSVDPQILGSVAVSVALVVFRLPDGEPAPPRESQGGFARLVVMVAIALGAAALLSSCRTPAAQSAKVSIVNCARDGVADLAADLAPAVETILTGDTPSWRDQLDAILTVGKDAGACAVQSVGLDLARRAAQLVGIHAEGQEATGAANAREYLESRHVVFEVAR